MDLDLQYCFCLIAKCWYEGVDVQQTWVSDFSLYVSTILQFIHDFFVRGHL